MKISAIAVSLVILTGCGTSYFSDDHIQREAPDTSHHKETVVESDIVPYVKRFEALYKKEVDIRITFNNLDYPKVGVCYTWTDGYRNIEIDTKQWKAMSDLGREEVIFHELGHCILGRGHDESKVDLGVFKQAPASIMYPYVFGDASVYREFKDSQYYKELFK